MTWPIPRWAPALFAAAAFWPAAPPVMAQTPDPYEVVVIGESTDGEAAQGQRVGYADLDLRREPGARVLLARIRSAAMTVCGPEPSIHDLKEQWRRRVCLYDAISGALRKVDSPKVAAMYDGES